MLDNFGFPIRKPTIPGMIRNSSFSYTPSAQNFKPELKKQHSSKNINKEFLSKSGGNIKIQQVPSRLSYPLPQMKSKARMDYLMPPQKYIPYNMGHQIKSQKSSPGFFIDKQSQKEKQLSKQFGGNLKIIVHQTQNEQVHMNEDKNRLSYNKGNFSRRSAGNLTSSTNIKDPGIFQQKRLSSSRKRPKSNQKSQLPFFLKKVKKENEVVLQDFEQIRRLGQGACGEVYLVRHKATGLLYALKILRKQHIHQTHNEENVFRQIKIHLSLDNEHIIHLYGIFKDEYNFMTDGCLWTMWKKQKIFSEKKTAKIILDIGKGVKYLHQNNILHRDIKLQNILLTKGLAKLGDFGCAVQSFCMRKSSIGSANYLSPQQIGQRFYHKKIDIWSIGIVTYELLFGSSPFQDEILHSLRNSTHNPNYELVFPAEIPISDEAKDFLIKVLQKNPNHRFSMQEALNHPFLKQHEVQIALPPSKQNSRQHSPKK